MTVSASQSDPQPLSWSLADSSEHSSSWNFDGAEGLRKRWKHSWIKHAVRIEDPYGAAVESVQFSPQEIAYDNWLARRPFVYHSPSDTVYLGSPKEHHSDVYERHSLPSAYTNETGTPIYRDDTHEGYVMQGHPTIDDEIDFFNSDHTHAFPQVLHALSEHTGVPIGRSRDNNWDFSFDSAFKQAGHRLNWTPGQRGKGLIDNDDNVHTWNVEGYAGEPTHWDYGYSVGMSDPFDRGGFWIAPTGEAALYDTPGKENNWLAWQAIMAADPRLKQGPEANDLHTELGHEGENWNFSKTHVGVRGVDPQGWKLLNEQYGAKTPPGFKPWQPGHNGKGMFVVGQPYLWSIQGNADNTHHFQAMNAIRGSDIDWDDQVTDYATHHIDHPIYIDRNGYEALTNGGAEPWQEFDHPYLKYNPPEWKFADHQGFTNWDTWNTKLMMDNERHLYDRSRQIVQQGGQPEHIRDWALPTIIGPHNKAAIEDAQSWNTIPEEERLDPNYEAFKNKHGDDPKAMDLLHGLVGGPDVSDSEPTLIDPELVNWHEIHQNIADELEENRRYEQGLDPTQREPQPDPDKPGDLTLPAEWTAGWHLQPAHQNSPIVTHEAKVPKTAIELAWLVDGLEVEHVAQGMQEITYDEHEHDDDDDQDDAEPQGHDSLQVIEVHNASHYSTTPAEELQNFVQQVTPESLANPNNPWTGKDPSANPSNPQFNPDLPGSFANPSNPLLNPDLPGSQTNPSNPEFNPDLPGSQTNPSNPLRNPDVPGSQTNPSNPQLNPDVPGSFANPSNPIHNPAFPTPPSYPRPQGVSENASLPPQSQWNFSSTIGQSWEPGQYGKGFFDIYGNLHTWIDWQQSDDEQQYGMHHYDYAEKHGLTIHPGTQFAINPDSRLDYRLPPGIEARVLAADPRILPPATEPWQFNTKSKRLEDLIHESIDYGQGFVNHKSRKMQIVLGDADEPELFDQVKAEAQKRWPGYEIAVGSEDYEFSVHPDKPGDPYGNKDYGKLAPGWEKFATPWLDEYQQPEPSEPDGWKWVWRDGKGVITPAVDDRGNRTYHAPLRAQLGHPLALNGAMDPNGGAEIYHRGWEEQPDQEQILEWLRQTHPNAHPKEGYDFGWTIAKRASQTWQPGQEGKGYIENDELHHWPVDEHYEPNHYEVRQTTVPPQAYLYIRPDGKTWIEPSVRVPGAANKDQQRIQYHQLYDEARQRYQQMAQQLDPRLQPEDDWKFSALTVNKLYEQRMAGMTPNQQQRFRQELEQQYGPENTEVIHQWPDGWTIHHLPTWNELGREGEMMHHCWAGMGGLVEDSEEYGPGSGIPINTKPYPGDEMALSLRDPNGWPHASFNYWPEEKLAFEFGGHGGNPGLKAEHAGRILDWAKPLGVRTDGTLGDEQWFPEELDSWRTGSRIGSRTAANQCPECGAQEYEHSEGEDQEGRVIKYWHCNACGHHQPDKPLTLATWTPEGDWFNPIGIDNHDGQSGRGVHIPHILAERHDMRPFSPGERLPSLPGKPSPQAHVRNQRQEPSSRQALATHISTGGTSRINQPELGHRPSLISSDRIAKHMIADSWDMRQWPDPTQPRDAKPPEPSGCTCPEGHKLDCPLHGLNADPSGWEGLWSIPENHPVGHPQDQPRNWTQAVSGHVQGKQQTIDQHANDNHERGPANSASHTWWHLPQHPGKEGEHSNGKHNVWPWIASSSEEIRSDSHGIQDSIYPSVIKGIPYGFGHKRVYRRRSKPFLGSDGPNVQPKLGSHIWRFASTGPSLGSHIAGLADQVPPAPGTSPIPEGTMRLWHYTRPDNIDSIRQQGLLYEKGRGDSGTGIDEPSKGVWASTRQPSDDVMRNAAVVEYWAHPEQLSKNAEHYWHREPLEWAAMPGIAHHVIMQGDVPPNQIAAIHEPWHHTYRYLQENYPQGDQGQLDMWLEPQHYDPEITPAVQAYREGLGRQARVGGAGYPDWEPGTDGKFIIPPEGDPIIWQTRHGQPHHDDVYPDATYRKFPQGWIDEKGNISPWRGAPFENEHRQQLLEAIPGARFPAEAEWNFSKVAGPMDEYLQPWTPGKEGKGIVYKDGSLVHWATNPMTNGPHHQSVVDFSRGPVHYLDYIDPEGHTDFDPAYERYWPVLQKAGLKPAYEPGELESFNPFGSHSEGAGKIGAMDYPPEIDRWLRGGCADYARALQDAAFEDEKELQLGTHTSPWGIEHVFAHDDKNAYDALGEHPLPYKERDWQDSYGVDPSHIEETYPVDEERIEEAYPHAVGTWANRTQGHTSRLNKYATIPWQVVESDMDPAQSYLHGTNYEWTHSPWLADPESGTIYLGRPGLHHQDIAEHHSLPSHMENWGHIDHGTISVGEVDKPEWVQGIVDALHEHVGPGFGEELGGYGEDPESWKFGAGASDWYGEIPNADPENVMVQNGGHNRDYAEDTQPWEPGYTGKAIGVVHQGQPTVHIWRTDKGSPHHVQVIAPMRTFDHRGMPIDTMSFGPGWEIGPDGQMTANYPQPAWEALIPKDLGLKAPTSPWSFSKVGVYEPKPVPWEPGMKGKGIIAPDGRVITWRDELPDDPHHPDMLDIHDPVYNSDKGYSLFERQDNTFTIRPDGTIRPSIWNIQEQQALPFDHIVTQDPRLKRPEAEEGWNFSKVATEGLPGTWQPGDSPEPDRVRSYDIAGVAPWDESIHIPVVYDPVEDIAHVGSYGAHHYHVMDAMGLSADREHQLSFGLWTPHAYVPDTGPTAHHQRAAELLGLPMQLGDSWNFARVASAQDAMSEFFQTWSPPQQPWQPGYTGKGLVLRNGEIVTWQPHANTPGSKLTPTWYDSPHHFDVKDWLVQKGAIGSHNDIKDELYIDPHGRAESVYGEYHDPQLLARYGLKPEDWDGVEDSWNFAKVATVPRVEDWSLDDPASSRHYDPYQHEQLGVPNIGSFIYYPQRQKIIYGNGWTHHQDLFDQLEARGQFNPYAEDHGTGLYWPDEGRLDYYGSEEHEPLLEQALGQHFQQPVQTERGWNFAKFFATKTLQSDTSKPGPVFPVPTTEVPDGYKLFTPEWEPWDFGKEGKGFFHPETGQVRAWAVKPDPRYPDDYKGPYHTDDAWPEVRWNSRIPFWLSPEGHIQTSYDHDLSPMLEYHPNLRLNAEGPDHWDFGTFGKVAQDQPQVIWYGQPGYTGDHSFLFNPERNEVHIGDESKHHADLEREAPDAGLNGYWQGAVYPDTAFSADPDLIFETYSHSTDPRWEPVHQLFNQMEGRQLPRSDINRWNFGKVAQGFQIHNEGVPDIGYYRGETGTASPWQLGNFGKGLLTNGHIYHWTADTDRQEELGYMPHHDEVIGGVHGQGIQDPAIYQEYKNATLFGIDPHGEISHYQGPQVDVSGAHPQWTMPQATNWSFGKTAALGVTWQPGEFGKAILTHTGDVHAWRDTGRPGSNHHSWMARHQIAPTDVKGYFEINPSNGGTVWDTTDAAENGMASPMAEEVAQKLGLQTGQGWNFGNLAKVAAKETQKGLLLHDGSEVWWPAQEGAHVTYMMNNGIHPTQVKDYLRRYDDGTQEGLKGFYGDWWDKEYQRMQPEWNFQGEDEERHHGVQFGNDEPGLTVDAAIAPGQQPCFFHPDRPAVAREGFAAMCPPCHAEYQQAKENIALRALQQDPEANG